MLRSPDTSNDSADRAAPIGARNDDSCLFSLDALKREELSSSARRDAQESGLIDIRALATMEATSNTKTTRALAIADPGDLFSGPSQYGAAATPFAVVSAPVVSAAPMEAASPPAKRPVLVGLGVLLSAALAVGAFSWTRSSGEAAAPTAAPMPASAAPAPPPAPPAVDAHAVEAVTPGQIAAPKPIEKTVAAAPQAPSPARPAAKAKTAAAAPPAKEAPAAPVVTCDLRCQMERAVEKKH